MVSAAFIQSFFIYLSSPTIPLLLHLFSPPLSSPPLSSPILPAPPLPSPPLIFSGWTYNLLHDGLAVIQCVLDTESLECSWNKTVLIRSCLESDDPTTFDVIIKSKVPGKELFYLLKIFNVITKHFETFWDILGKFVRLFDELGACRPFPVS